MKTVKQTAEVLFQSLDFTDKVVMLPIIGKLAESVKNNADLHISIDNDDYPIFISLEIAKKIFKILSDLGCRTSLGESYEDIIKSNNSQEKQTKHCILQLFNWGNSKLETVKIIKEQLYLGLREAKDLVDSCPINIDLSQYPIKPDEYQDILLTLKEKGVHVNLTIKE